MEDGDLVQRVRAGDHDAFGELIERHHGHLYGTCVRLTGDIAAAEELAHDAFVEAYLKLAQLRDGGRFRAWVRQIALNLCRLWWRSRRGALPLDDETAVEDDDVEADDDLLAAMSRGLSQLSPPHRLVLTLHYLEGLSYQDVACFLDVPIGTVMSRLHRARKALRRQIDADEPREDVPVIPNDQFRQEVDAEISIVLDMFAGAPDEAERLSVVLRNSPDRLAGLIRTADAEMVERLAILLPQLGAEGADVVLRGAFAGEPAAAALLRGAVGRWRSTERRGSNPTRTLHVLLDRLLVVDAPPAARAELLVDLLDATDDGPSAALLTCVLLCRPDEAFALLWGRFAAARQADRDLEPFILFALCRFGSRIAETIADELAAGRADKHVLALTVAVGRCFKERSWIQDTPSDHFDYERRARWALPPLPREGLHAALLQRVADPLAALVADDRPATRDAAVRALGAWRADRHIALLAECAAHESVSTRRAAVMALAEFGDAAPRDVLIASAADELPVRYAALDALGRLEVGEAVALLTQLADDDDGQTAESALIALGRIGGDEAGRILHEKLRSPDKRRQKAAAKALYRPSRSDHVPPRRPHRVRGMAEPFRYVSLDAVIRYATPEIRRYDERELTAAIARICVDYSLARRNLVDYGLMTRADGIYRFTPLGERVWRVEHYTMDHYLR